MVLEIIQRDIPARGIGYLILRDCPEDRLGEALGRGMDKLKKAGAKTVWATSLPEGEPLNNGPVGLWRLAHVHDMVRMKRSLPLPRPERRLNLRSPRRADETILLDLMNRAYAQVPNAVTLLPSDLRRSNRRYTLAWQGNRAVGAYALDLSEKTPELLLLAVEPAFRRQGIGRSLLRSAMESLRAPVCSLTVSTANTPALALLEAEGFVSAGLVSGWFEVV